MKRFRKGSERVQKRFKKGSKIKLDFDTGSKNKLLPTHTGLLTIYKKTERSQDMINTREASEFLDISPHRIKRILHENDIFTFERKGNGTGQIQVPSETMAKLLDSRGKTILKRKAVIKSQKGGVGGTTNTLNVAIRAAQRGAKVLVWDLDPESNATSFLRKDDFDYGSAQTTYEMLKNDVPMENCIYETRFDGVFMVPSKGTMRRVEREVHDRNPRKLLATKLKEIEHLDFTTILFDLPPTFSRITESAYITSDICLLPTDASSFGIEGAILTKEDIESSCKEWDQRLPEIKVFLSRAHNTTRNSVRDSWEFLVKEFGPDLLPTRVPEKAAVLNAVNEGYTVFEGKTDSEVKRAISELVDIVAPIVDKKEVLQ